jgi:hypothetical protein
LSDELERAIDLTRRAAAAYGRPDLVERVDLVRTRVATVPLIAFVGEYQSGKSSLVNALTVEPVCPADAEWTTTVPTVVYLGGPRHALAIPVDDDGAPDPLALDDLPSVVTDRDDRWERVERCDVRLDLLDEGDDDPFGLVDTPGAGGWSGRLGARAVGWLPLAMGAVVAHDGGGPLTGSEMELIELAARLSPAVAVAVTRTDLHPAWREIVHDTRTRLDARGLQQVPVIAVSARLAAAPDEAVRTRSGIDDLFDWIVTVAAGANAGRRLRTTCLAVVGSLEADLAAERALLQGAEADAEPTSSSSTSSTSSTAAPPRPRPPWPTVLADGITDLGTDLDTRWKAAGSDLLRACDEHLGQSDPARDWPAFESWLRQESTRVSTEVFAVLHAGLADLAAELAEALHAEAADLPVEPGRDVLADPLGRLDLALRLQATASLGSRSFSALRASYSGMALAGMMAGVAGLSLAGPALVVFGAAMAGKTVKDEQTKQLEQRRQQARAAARRYLDDLSALVHQLLRDGLRTGQRTLRDHGALLAEGTEERRRRRHPGPVGDGDRQRRVADLDAELVRIAKLRARIEALPADDDTPSGVQP